MAGLACADCHMVHVSRVYIKNSVKYIEPPSTLSEVQFTPSPLNVCNLSLLKFTLCVINPLQLIICQITHDLMYKGFNLMHTFYSLTFTMCLVRGKWREEF